MRFIQGIHQRIYMYIIYRLYANTLLSTVVLRDSQERGVFASKSISTSEVIAEEGPSFPRDMEA